MKPTSIVTLIIAVLLVILGLVTCIVAQNMANANGEFLFSESREDGLVNTVDLTESEVSKIELIVADAEINIIGKSDSSRIEFVNFRDNFYNLSVANRVLSFTEIPDVTSMLKFWENGFTFKGMRYILQFAKDKKQTDENKKVINLYLTNDREIKVFDIKADSGEINIRNMVTSTDYNITTVDAKVHIDGVKTTSYININSGKDIAPANDLTLDLGTAIVGNMNINAKRIEMLTNVFRCSEETVINCEDGSISIRSVKKPDNLKLDIRSDSGNIYIDNELKTSPYTHTTAEISDPKITITAKSADVKIYPASGSADDSEISDNSGNN